MFMKVDTMNDPFLNLDGAVTSRFRPCIEILVFATLAREVLAPQFIAFHDEFCKQRGPTLNWYETNVMKTAKRLSGTPTDQVKQMLSDKKALKGYLLGVEQHLGASASEYALPSFQFFSEQDVTDPDDMAQRHFLRVCLPLDETKNPDGTVELLRTLLSMVDFDSGYCGHSYYWDTGSPEAERELAQSNRGWLARYPGLSYGKPLGLFSLVDFGILGVSWLTFLGKAKTGALGGSDALAARLPAAIETYPIANDRGLLIRAGTQPELGDVNRGRDLPSYHAVGKALASLAVPEEWIDNLLVTGMSAEESQEWYMRFFGDSDD